MGRIKLAIWPLACQAARMASCKSSPTPDAVREVRTQLDTVPARAWMSLAKGGS
ncbi:hypothetical protein [Pseudomonas sp. 34 E 7]|nr:hypothetical protein [Pseudomonas sp. 34 E 7]